MFLKAVTFKVTGIGGHGSPTKYMEIFSIMTGSMAVDMFFLFYGDGGVLVPRSKKIKKIKRVSWCRTKNVYLDGACYKRVALALVACKNGS